MKCIQLVVVALLIGAAAHTAQAQEETAGEEPKWKFQVSVSGVAGLHISNVIEMTRTPNPPDRETAFSPTAGGDVRLLWYKPDSRFALGFNVGLHVAPVLFFRETRWQSVLTPSTYFILQYANLWAGLGLGFPVQINATNILGVPLPSLSLGYDLMLHRILGLRMEVQVTGLFMVTFAEFRTGIVARF
jgi:hypothetical protein